MTVKQINEIDYTQPFKWLNNKVKDWTGTPILMTHHEIGTWDPWSEEEDDFNWGWWDKLKFKYYNILPYDWRPGQIWYRLKCFFWHRYTVIKPRYLKWYTWTDRCSLIEHYFFEIVADFVENELGENCHIDWESDVYSSRAKKAYVEAYEFWKYYNLFHNQDWYEYTKNKSNFKWYRVCLGQLEKDMVYHMVMVSKFHRGMWT